ncbi:hypothetical protein [Paenibacillus sp. NPDC093718]|uniref:hypothetical protein n=1 Tax=Paenibacillus sp. NPDC093718 TaxID=3390601 RepID=UPI003CFBD12B
MILRHVTLKSKLSSIYQHEALLPAAELGIRMRSADKDYVAFELNPTSDVLVRIFPMLKSNSFNSKSVMDGDQFELLFDGKKMSAEGFLIEQLNQLKIQIRPYIGQNGFTEEEYESIGAFVFVQSRVPIKYLTEDSRATLEDYIRQNPVVDAQGEN